MKSGNKSIKKTIVLFLSRHLVYFGIKLLGLWSLCSMLQRLHFGGSSSGNTHCTLMENLFTVIIAFSFS